MNRWKLVVGFLVLSAVSSSLGTEAAQITPVKEQIIKLLASITMKLNYAVDEKFCRQFFEDFKKQTKIEYVQPIVRVDRVDDPALAAFLAKCPTVKWIGAEADEPGYRLNTRVWDQFGNLWVGTANFRLYHVDIDNDKANGKEHVFYSDGFVRESLSGEELPPVEELDRTTGEYVAVNFDDCAVLGGVEVGRGGLRLRPVYSGIIQYQGRLYIYDLAADGGYKLHLQKYMEDRKNFTIVCRYWQ